MLKIVQKKDIPPQNKTNQFVIEQSEESTIRDSLSQGKTKDWSNVQKHYQFATSINADILAQIIQEVSSKMTPQNYEESIDFILYLYELPHSQSQLRHHLKHSFKIDPVCFLLCLFERKELPLALKLASTIIDTYTLALMLNGKEVVLLWKQSVKTMKRQYQSLEAIQNILNKMDEKEEKTHEQNQKNKDDGFKKIRVLL